MNQFLLCVFVLVAAAMIAPAFWRKDYRLQFPCLAGFTVLFQVALPLASLSLQPDTVSATSLTRFSVMAILCLLAAWVGYEWRQGSKKPVLWQFDPKRLAISATILFVFGGLFVLKLGRTVPDLDLETGQMTGIVTIYGFFADTTRYGAILAAILYMRTKDRKFLVFLLPQLWTYYKLFMIGRRSPTGEIIVIVCMLLWFYRKWAIPPWLMALGMFGMALFCFNVGVIRNTVDQSLSERIEAVKEADVLHSLSLKSFGDDRKYVEIFNATKFMEAKAMGGHYTFGRHFWNGLVFGFVPGQFVGKDFKKSLMIPLEDDTLLTGFEKSSGTCESGIGESFMAFGYFGCGLFFILGAFMRRLWEGAARNSILHQFLLMLCTLGSLMSFSQGLWPYLNMMVHIGVFTGPLFRWSRAHPGQQLTGEETKRSGRHNWKNCGVQAGQNLAPHSVTAQEVVNKI